MTSFVRNTDNCDELAIDIQNQKLTLSDINQNIFKSEESYKRLLKKLNNKLAFLEANVVKEFLEITYEFYPFGKVAKGYRTLKKLPKSVKIIDAMNVFIVAFDDYRTVFEETSYANKEVTYQKKRLEEHLFLMSKTRRKYQDCLKVNNKN